MMKTERKTTTERILRLVHMLVGCRTQTEVDRICHQWLELRKYEARTSSAKPAELRPENVPDAWLGCGQPMGVRD